MISLKTMRLALVAASLLVTGTASANPIGLNFVDNGNSGVQNGATDALGATGHGWRHRLPADPTGTIWAGGDRRCL